MRNLIVFLITALLLTGCMQDDNRTSALSMMRQEDNQTRHYRPVHLDHPDWSIHQLSKTLTLRTGTEQIKVSTRYNSEQSKVVFYDTFIETARSVLPVWNNIYMIVRKDGHIIDYVRPVDQKIEILSASSLDAGKADENRIVFQCDTFGSLAIITTSQTTLQYSIRDDEVFNEYLSVKPLPDQRRFTILNKTKSLSNEACQGEILESPFSILGTLIFHSNELPLPERTALAWYLTVTNTTCQ